MTNNDAKRSVINTADAVEMTPSTSLARAQNFSRRFVSKTVRLSLSIVGAPRCIRA